MRLLSLRRRIDVAHRQLNRRVDVNAVRDAFEREARDRQRAAAILRLPHGALEVAPEGRAFEQAGIGIDDTLGLERLQRSPEACLERLQAHERKQPVDQADGSALDADEIGQPLVVDAGIGQADQRSETRLSWRDEQRLDDARLAIADHHAVDVAR
jgi:hypothetical protein